MLRPVLAFAVATAATVGGTFPAAAQYGGGAPGQSVRCESWNYQPARCAADLGRGGNVQLQQVIAGRCVEGDTWRWDRGGINVSGGCRATFFVTSGGGGYPGGPGGGYPGGGGGYPGGRTIECNSWKFKYQTCALPGGGRPDLVRVIAGNCIEGQTWGGRRGEVWVDKGCRAVFASGRGGGGGGGGYPGGPGGGQAQYVTCESWKFAYTECPSPSRRAQLDRVIAGNCIEGQSYGFGPRGIWVDKGCRARFVTYG